jgi:hypothetical protein
MLTPSASLAGLLALAACAPAPGASGGPPPAASGAERGYTPPPAVTSAVRAGEGRVLLYGTAPPASRLRVASPAGQEMFALADAGGTWRMALPPAADVRLFGVSAPVAGRLVQSEGYLAVTPGGEAARLRAGSGAVVLDRPGPGIALLAADFDRKGGTVVSGRAPAHAPVKITADGVSVGQASVDASGRFILALDKPLSPGVHAIVASAGGASAEVSLTISPPDPLTAGPFRAESTPAGWRVDWLTPGGGVQSTVLFQAGGV